MSNTGNPIIARLSIGSVEAPPAEGAFAEVPTTEEAFAEELPIDFAEVSPVEEYFAVEPPAEEAFAAVHPAGEASMEETPVEEAFAEALAAGESFAEEPHDGDAAAKPLHFESSGNSFRKIIDSDQVSSTQADEESGSQRVRIRVSSKHLRLASAILESMPQPTSQKNPELHLTKYAELQLPNDNPAALLVLLNAIHGRWRQLPHTIDLRMLVEISILVDKYELLEIAEVLLDRWYPALVATIPQAWNNDLLPWMCISMVFQNPKIWRHVTRIAQYESQYFITDHPLPVLHWSLSM